MEKKKLYIAIVLVIAVIISVSASAYVFSYFSGRGRDYRSQLNSFADIIYQHNVEMLNIVKAYKNGEIGCGELYDRISSLLGTVQEEPDIISCYADMNTIPFYERYLSDIGVLLKAMEDESSMSDFEIGMMINSGKIPDSMAPLITSLARAASAGGTFLEVVGSCRAGGLIFTGDNVTVEVDEGGLERLSGCLLDAAEDGMSLVSGECLRVSEDHDYDVSELEIFGIYIFDDAEKQMYRDSYMKTHQDVLDNVIPEPGALEDAVDLHEEGMYMESIVQSSLVLSDVFVAESLGCNGEKTRERFNACLNEATS
jgi:hypothetical protein